MNAADAIIALGNQLSEEKNAAFDLWTWLPSYKTTQKHHEDYVDNFTPSVKDILVEAAMYFAYLKDVSLQLRNYTVEENEWFAKCSCGEDHIPDE